MNEPTITRHTGNPTGVLGLMCGSGVSGTTAELDAVVKEAAEGLRALYGLDVVIRFNSDRYSGGAWLKHDTGHWLSSDAAVGITACLITQERIDATLRKYPEWAEDGYPERGPGIYISIGLATAVMHDVADAPEDEWRHAQGLDGKPKVWGGADTVDEALRTVSRLVDRERLT